MRTDPWYPLRYELARSRRYEKGFVLVAGHVGGGQKAGGRQTKAAVDAYARVLRDTDAVWAHGGRLYVLLAETAIDQADEVIARLGQSVPESSRISGAEMAAFPEDGLTTAALIEAVSRRAAPALPGLPAPVPARTRVAIGGPGALP